MNTPSRFDALANVLYTEHEITPETMALKEDSFKEPQDGYTPEDWMKIDYRKRRYITLRNRAKAGQPTGVKPVTPTTSIKVLPPEPDAPEVDSDVEDADTGDTFDTTDQELVGVEEPVVSGDFTEAIVDFVSSKPGTTRTELFDFLARSFGDKLNTEGQVNSVIRQAVQNGDIEFNASDVAFIPGQEVSDGEPTDTDIANVGVAPSSEDKKRERHELFKKFMAWRAQKQLQGIKGGQDDEDEDEDEGIDDDENPTRDADKVLRRPNYNRLKRSGIDDPESVTMDQD